MFFCGLISLANYANGSAIAAVASSPMEAAKAKAQNLLVGLLTDYGHTLQPQHNLGMMLLVNPSLAHQR